MATFIRYVGTRRFRWRLLYLIRGLFRATGRSWNDFYAWMLDYQDRQLTLDQILARPRNPGVFKGLWDWSRGEYYLDFLKQHGFEPTNRFLDCGCGYGRVAIPVMQFQDGSGEYIGTELSRRRIDVAHEWIRREGLSGKPHQLVVSKDNRMPFLDDRSVDIVWALSVFNHMPDRELEVLLAAIARVLRPDGRLFAYYVVPEPGAPETVKTFRRSDATMEKFLSAAGLTGRLLDDWDDDLGDNKPTRSRMRLCMKKTPAGADTALQGPK